MCKSMCGSPEYSKQGCSGAALLREARAASALDHPKVPINAETVHLKFDFSGYATYQDLTAVVI
jgi:hypothetical protein